MRTKVGCRQVHSISPVALVGGEMDKSVKRSRCVYGQES